jgi:hypothetical protein
MSPPCRRLGAVGVLLLVVLALSPVATSAGKTTPRLGSHSMIGPEMDPAQIDALFKASRDAHLRTVRLDVLVTALFPNGPDAPDWSTLDAVRASTRRYRLQVLALLSAVPWWESQCPPQTEKYYRCPVRDDAEWGRMIEQIAARAPEIRYWEILNEANLINPGTGEGEYFYGDAVQYARFLRVTSNGLKRGEPKAKVVFTGVVQPYDAWLAKVLAQPGTLQAFDIANAHFRGGIGKLDDMVRAAKAAFARGGFHGPLWVSEMGYSSDQAFQYDPYYLGYDPLGAQRQQARYVHDAMTTLLRSGANRVFVTLRDLDSTWGIFTSEGLISWPGAAAKPSFYAVRRYARKLIRHAARRAARGLALRDSARARARLRLAQAQRRGSARRAASASR